MLGKEILSSVGNRPVSPLLTDLLDHILKNKQSDMHCIYCDSQEQREKKRRRNNEKTTRSQDWWRGQNLECTLCGTEILNGYHRDPSGTLCRMVPREEKFAVATRAFSLEEMGDQDLPL